LIETGIESFLKPWLFLIKRASGPTRKEAAGGKKWKATQSEDAYADS